MIASHLHCPGVGQGSQRHPWTENRPTARAGQGGQGCLRTYREHARNPPPLLRPRLIQFYPDHPGQRRGKSVTEAVLCRPGVTSETPDRPLTSTGTPGQLLSLPP